MKQVIYIVIGIGYGTILGYFFLFFLVHVASLHMESDDDLNQAVLRGLIIWPILILLTGWLGKQLYLGIIGGQKLSIFQRSLFVFAGAITGTIVGDLTLSLSGTLINWRDLASTGEGENFIILFIWILFSFLGGLFVDRLLVRYSLS